MARRPRDAARRRPYRPRAGHRRRPRRDPRHPGQCDRPRLARHRPADASRGRRQLLLSSVPTARVFAGITTRNRAGILPKALDSLRRQSYPALQIAVLDDASDDTTPALRASYPEVAWLRHDRTQGIIESRNELMRSTDADYY